MSNAEITVRHLLQAIADEDWFAVWGFHDPDALVVVGPQVLPHRLVPRPAYAKVLRSIADAQRDRGLPRFRLIEERVVADEHGSLLMAQIVDESRQVTFEAGFRFAGDGGLVAAVAEPGGSRAVDVQAAADLVQLPLPTDPREAFLTSLHHSYARRLQGMGRAVRVLPEARFTCQGRGDCCQVGHWKISVSDNQIQPLAWLSAAAGTTPFRVGAAVAGPAYADPAATTDRHRLAVGRSPGCHQLDGAGACQLHASAGWQPIPVCQLYPVGPVPTPDGFDVTVHFSCETVCRNQGERLSEQLPDLRRRLWPYQFRLESVPEVLALHQGDEPTLAWPTYREWETDLLALLDAFTARGPVVLHEGSRLLAERIGPGAAAVLDTDGLFQGVLNPALPNDWRPGWLGGGYGRAWEVVRLGPVAFQNVGDTLQRYLRTMLFRKAGLVGGAAGAGFPWGTVVLAYRMVVADAQFRAWLEQRPTTNEADLIAAVRAVEHLLGHEPLADWLGGLPGNPLEAPETWLNLVGSPS